MKKENKKIFYLCFLVFIFFTYPNNSQGAVFPLEITNIKPAGSGSPAISTTNRIFRAYPGIEYNVRVAAIGGLYPYIYSISNEPDGMTINARTGEIFWPNPQIDSDNITLEVTDAEATTISTTWSIDVTTQGFIFVDNSYSGVETGSITQPYGSLGSFLTATFNGDTSDIVYFRTGNYQLVEHNNGSPNGLNISSNPTNWIAFPNELVTLQGGNGVGEAHRIAIFNNFYFDGLVFKDFVNYGIMTNGASNYKTVRNCVFDGLVPDDDINNNYGFLHTTNNGPGYYFVVQDNEFMHWRQAAAIGSLYNDKKMLIENNYIHDNLAISTPIGIGTTIGIAPKYYTDYLTVRGNKVIMNSGDLLGGINAAFYDAIDVEINYNLFVKAVDRGGHIFDWEPGYQRKTYYWRNTLIGDLTIRSGLGGPYYINNNVISNPNTGFEDFIITNYISHGSWAPTLSEYATVANNLANATASNLIDSSNEYKLVPAQSSYVGINGWQLDDGLTPLELENNNDTMAPNSPIGLNVL